jgi:hypothetical protein
VALHYNRPHVNSQLTAIVEDLQAVERRLRALRARLSRECWTQTPAPGSWSPSECVEHLSLTTRTALPLIRNGLREAARHAARSSSPYRKDVVGWLVYKLMEPTGRLRARTVPAWEPRPGASPDAVMDDFITLQSELIACVRAADLLPLDRVSLRSPFDGRVTYSLYSALTLLPRRPRQRGAVVSAGRLAHCGPTTPLDPPAATRQSTLAPQETARRRHPCRADHVARSVRAASS